MAVALNTVNVNADTFDNLITKLNLALTAISTQVVTANSNANGSVTTGNTFINGIVFANTLSTSSLRGGNVQSSANLAIGSNTVITGFASVSQHLLVTTYLTVGTFTVNTTAFSVGNSTVNTSINSTTIVTTDIDTTIANVVSGTIEILSSNTIAANAVTVGNVAISTSLMSIGNSTVNTVVNSTAFAVANGSGTFVVAFGDSVSNTQLNERFKFGNTTTTGTSAQEVDSFLLSAYRTVEYTYSVKDNAANNYMSGKSVLMHFDGGADLNEYAVIQSNSYMGIFSPSTNATHAILSFTPVSANTTIKFARINVAV